MTNIHLPFTKLTVLCAVAIGVLLLAEADEARAQYGYTGNHSFGYSVGSNSGSGPNGSYSHNRSGISFRNGFSYSTPYGSYSFRFGVNGSHRWGSGYSPNTGSWGYHHRSGGSSYHNSFRRRR